LRDAEHFDARLSKIDGSGDLGAYVANIVKEKAIVAPVAAPKAPQPNPPASESRTSMEKPKPSAEVPVAATEAPVS